VNTSDADPRLELAEIASLVRAHVEWLRESGAVGLPRGERPASAGTGTHVAAPGPAAAAGPAPLPPPSAVPSVTSPPPMQRAATSAPGAAPNDAVAPPRREAAPPVVAPSAVTPPAVAPPPASFTLASPSHGSGGAPSLIAASPAAAALPLEERNRRLEVLATSVRGCERCALHTGRTQTVFARGQGTVGLCFVGEGPGADEDAQGFPFVGKAGQLLDRMIEAMGFSRDDVYVCNIVKCRPPNNRKPEPEEMAACMPYLIEQLELLAPEVIVALGATAVQGLFGTTEGITRLRGRWKLYKGRVPVMPTFHPAFLLRHPAAKKEVWDDLQAVLRQMGRTVPARR
jgi:DNA polymerase